MLIWADQMEKGAISSFAVVALVMFKAPSFQILSYLGWLLFALEQNSAHLG